MNKGRGKGGGKPPKEQAGNDGIPPDVGRHVIRGIDVEVSGIVRIIDKDGNIKAEQEVINIDEEG